MEAIEAKWKQHSTSVLEDFEIVKRLGSGSFGIVYKCVSQNFDSVAQNKPVACHTCLPIAGAVGSKTMEYMR